MFFFGGSFWLGTDFFFKHSFGNDGRMEASIFEPYEKKGPCLSQVVKTKHKSSQLSCFSCFLSTFFHVYLFPFLRGTNLKTPPKSTQINVGSIPNYSTDLHGGREKESVLFHAKRFAFQETWVQNIQRVQFSDDLNVGILSALYMCFYMWCTLRSLEDHRMTDVSA